VTFIHAFPLQVRATVFSLTPNSLESAGYVYPSALNRRISRTFSGFSFVDDVDAISLDSNQLYIGRLSLNAQWIVNKEL
jgi:hypothetical protein